MLAQGLTLQEYEKKNPLLSQPKTHSFVGGDPGEDEPQEPKRPHPVKMPHEAHLKGLSFLDVSHI